MKSIRCIIAIFSIVAFLTSGLYAHQHSSYESWKENQRKKLELNEVTTFAGKVFYFTNLFRGTIKKIKDIKKGDLERQACSLSAPHYITTFVAVHEQELLYTYTILREMLGQKVANTLEEVSKEWVQEVAKAAYPYAYIEQKKKYPPLLGTVELLTQAKEYLNLKEDIFALSDLDPKGGYSTVHKDGRYSIALPTLPDRNSRLFVLYHEIAHIIYRDVEVRQELLDHNRDVPQAFLDDPEFAKYCQLVEDYKGKALTAFDESTRVGRYALEIMSKYSSFWSVPFRPKLYRTLTLLRNQEARADLFACEKLYEQGKIEPIVAQIAEKVLSGYIVALDYDEHPSHFERALYMAGFLVAKGLDINQLLKEWQQEGISVINESEPALQFSEELFPLPSSKGAGDFYAAYAKALPSSKDAYVYWKRERESYWRAEQINGPILQKFDLLTKLLLFLRHLKEVPTFTPYQIEALYSYTMLREFLGLPTNVFVKDIDEEWIEREVRLLWKAAFLAEYSLLPLADKCYKLIWIAIKSLIAFYKMPNWPYQGENALYAYNVLRELRNLPGVESVDDINQVWLKEQEVLSFKESVEGIWQRKGTYDVGAQITYLQDQLKWNIPLTEDIHQAYIAEARIMNLCAMLKERLPSLPRITECKEVTDEYLALVDKLVDEYKLHSIQAAHTKKNSAGLF